MGAVFGAVRRMIKIFQNSQKIKYQSETPVIVGSLFASEIPSFQQFSEQFISGPKTIKKARGTPCRFFKITFFQIWLKLTLKTCTSIWSPFLNALNKFFLAFFIFYFFWGGVARGLVLGPVSKMIKIFKNPENSNTQIPI